MKTVISLKYYSISVLDAVDKFRLISLVNLMRIMEIDRLAVTTRMWANAQRDGRPAEHRWRPLFNAAKFGCRPLLDAVQ